MSIKTDIEDIIKEWKTSSKWFKIVVIISAFITLNPLATLSDTVFEWKGFISDGIEFYKLLIVEPIKQFLNGFNLKYNSVAINELIFSSIIYFSIWRVVWYENKLKNISNSTRNIVFLFLLTSFILVLIKSNKPNYELDNLSFYFAIGGYFFMLFIPKMSKKSRIIYLAPVLFSIITILILAAINAGLTR